jgi:CheY-like chemotaxis protein
MTMGCPQFETIMMIDDNPIDLYVVGRLVRKNNLGKVILEYNSAEKALDYLQSNIGNHTAWPQLLLVDIYMPGMSGFEFMAAFDKFPEQLKKKCHIYIVSSSIDENDLRKANNDRNVIAFQEKPITAAFIDILLAQL